RLGLHAGGAAVRGRGDPRRPDVGHQRRGAEAAPAVQRRAAGAGGDAGAPRPGVGGLRPPAPAVAVAQPAGRRLTRPGRRGGGRVPGSEEARASGSFVAGRLPERTNGAASKAVVAFGSPWVRIPHLPLTGSRAACTARDPTRPRRPTWRAVRVAVPASPAHPRAGDARARRSPAHGCPQGSVPAEAERVAGGVEVDPPVLVDTGLHLGAAGADR